MTSFGLKSFVCNQMMMMRCLFETYACFYIRALAVSQALQVLFSELY